MNNYSKLLIANILQHPADFQWSEQGLGMLRLYLDSEHVYRLHVWDDSVRVPGVSPMHTHPWDLESTIVAGKLRQHRYTLAAVAAHNVDEYNVVTIKCGENAHELDAPSIISLAEQPLEIYREGQSYSQNANEIHWSLPDNGTVTLVKRTFGLDRESAKVYWRGKGPFVSAEPHPASPGTVKKICDRALERWF
jgi:hypothetical protein